MKNLSDQWVFFPRKRGALSDKEVAYWRSQLTKLLKVGIEIELNLPEKNGNCNRANRMCQCIAVFQPKTKMPSTSQCFEQCSNWDASLDEQGKPKHPKDGNCAIAKEHGCAGVYCSAFQSPCPSCNLYDRGCNSCPELYDITRDPKNIRAIVEKELKPTNFVGEYGASGVYKVCDDGSLLGKGSDGKSGIEIATVGRRPQFFAIYDSMKQIMDICKKYGAYTNERCSVHVHLLASYLTAGFNEGDRGREFIQNEITELEKPMPDIILANFHQLIRKFHVGLIWLGVAGTDMNTLTRWEKFRKPILEYSALRFNMASVVEEVSRASKHKPKYSIINYEPTAFDEDSGFVRRLHLEARHLDGMMSPSVVAAHAILIYALMLKAVDISRYGILESGNKDYMAKQKEMLKALCNGDGDWGNNRHSDTTRIAPYLDSIIDQSLQLVRLVKNVIAEQTPADRILRELARKPVAIRLIEGRTWDQIEADLGPGEESAPSHVQQLLTQIIDTSSVIECANMAEWAEAAVQTLQGSYPELVADKGDGALKESVEEYVSRGISSGRLLWSQEIGGFTMKG